MKAGGSERGDVAAGAHAAPAAARPKQARRRSGGEAPSMMTSSPKAIINRERDERGRLVRITITAPAGAVIDELHCAVRCAPAPRRRRRDGADDR
jgi:hypothetical protein